MKIKNIIKESISVKEAILKALTKLKNKVFPPEFKIRKMQNIKQQMLEFISANLVLFS